MKIYESSSELIGKTPLVRLYATERKYGANAKIFAKLEYFNPAGSSKDRAALYMINEAEKRGELKEGSVIIEPTSGNTGIGLASIAAVRGYRTIIVMPETMSEERKTLMKAYGAELVLTPGALGMKGAIEKAEELKKTIPGGFIPGQFDNPDNAKAHFETTGPEIYSDTDGEVDILVCGIGTGGTITGTGRYLKSVKPSVRVIGAEPLSSPFLTEGRSGAHKIQGLGAGFVPKVLDVNVCDGITAVSDEDALSYAREFGSSEGFLIGISSGAALKAAVEEAKRPENSSKSIVVIFPDSGDRYLSTELYK